MSSKEKIKLLNINNPNRDSRSSSNDSRHESSLPWIATGAGTVAVAALALLPRGHEAPDPTPVQPTTYETLAEQSAQIPYNPETDELVIDGIRVKPNNLNKNNASEAVLKDPRVQDYIAKHPTESSSITTSSMSVPEAGTYAIVNRDIDNDGDKDAVAVPINQ